MTLKLYVDRMSQSCREVIIFCKLNGIDFEEVNIHLNKRQQLSAEFREINPIQQIPAIMDGRFKLSERSLIAGHVASPCDKLMLFDNKGKFSHFNNSEDIFDSNYYWEGKYFPFHIVQGHAILRYLTCAFPRIADHWYPADLYKRAKVESVLDWHRSTLPRGPGSYVFYSVLAPIVGLPLNTKAAARTEKNLIASLAMIESVWLQKKGRFLLGSNQPSIADISLACEIMQLEVLDEKDRERILGPFKRVLKWLDDTKNAMAPHFEEVHSTLYKVKEKLQKQRITQSGRKPVLHSKM